MEKPQKIAAVVSLVADCSSSSSSQPRASSSEEESESFEAGVARWLGEGGPRCGEPLRSLRPLNVGNWNDAVTAEEEAEEGEELERARAERERGRRDRERERARQRKERQRWR